MTFQSTFDLTCPDSATSMTPGERVMCNITIDVIDQDVESEVEVVTTLNISYVGMVVRSLAVVEVGSNIESNLGSLLSQTPIFTSHVNENSTQKDRVKLSLGRLHNNGESRYIILWESSTSLKKKRGRIASFLRDCALHHPSQVCERLLKAN